MLDLWDARGMLEGNGLVELARTLVSVGLQPVVGRSSGNPSVPSDDPLFWSGIEVQDTPQRGQLRPTRTWACRLMASPSIPHAGFALFEAAVLAGGVHEHGKQHAATGALDSQVQMKVKATISSEFPTNTPRSNPLSEIAPRTK